MVLRVPRSFSVGARNHCAKALTVNLSDSTGAGSVETTGTGRWAQAGVPHKGWHCIDIEELNEQDHICEMCEARQVRFVHVMEHPA